MALLAEFFGGKPKVPAFVPVDVQAEQQKAIGGNTAALPGLLAQAGKVNTFNQNEVNRMLELAMPGYAKIRDQITGNLADLTAGKIPDDVSAAVSRNAAGRSLYGGFGGSGMSRNLQARDLGLTSLDLMTKGMDSATKWIASSRSPQFDVTSMFVRPEFQAQFAAAERNAKFQRDYVKNQWDWFGSFGQQAVRFEDSVSELAVAALGSMG